MAYAHGTVGSSGLRIPAKALGIILMLKKLSSEKVPRRDDLAPGSKGCTKKYKRDQRRLTSKQRTHAERAKVTCIPNGFAPTLAAREPDLK